MKRVKTIMPLICILMVAMIFTTLLIPSSSFGQDNDKAEVPDWREEDKWVYDVEPKFGKGDLTLYVNNTPIDDDVIRIWEKDDENYKDYEVFKLDSEMRGEFGKTNESFRKTSLNKTLYYEKDTLDVVSKRSVNGTINHYKPLWNKFDFPIEVGDTWTSNSSVLRANGSKIGNQGFEYNCTNKTHVSVPAGSYSAYRITRNRTINDPLGEIDLVMYYSPEVKNVVKIDFNNVKGQFQYSQDLRSYEPAPPEDNNRTPSLETATVLGGVLISALFVAKYSSKEN